MRKRLSSKYNEIHENLSKYKARYVYYEIKELIGQLALDILIIYTPTSD